jgi:AraC-like DNA-binding protein
MLPALRELVESQKRAENICKAIKEITEPAIYAVKDEAGAFFKFSKESYTSKITDTRALFDRMIGGGIPADKILDFATISIKDAAEVMGMSESAFRDTFGDLISDTPRKPTMKAV